MKTIIRIIKKSDFKLYNIPDDFGEEAEITIRPTGKTANKKIFEKYQITTLHKASGMIQLLNEPEEDVWNNL